jgi:hypothetical protein
MRTIRWLELTSGLAGAAIGLFQLRHIVFDPIFSTSSNTGQQRQVSLAESGDIPLITIISLSLVAVVLLIAAASAIMHSQSGQVFWQRALWIAAVLLVAYSILAIGTIGLLLLPAAILMLLAALFSLGTHAPAPQ